MIIESSEQWSMVWNCACYRTYLDNRHHRARWPQNWIGRPRSRASIKDKPINQRLVLMISNRNVDMIMLLDDGHATRIHWTSNWIIIIIIDVVVVVCPKTYHRENRTEARVKVYSFLRGIDLAEVLCSGQSDSQSVFDFGFGVTNCEKMMATQWNINLSKRRRSRRILWMNHLHDDQMQWNQSESFFFELHMAKNKLLITN